MTIVPTPMPTRRPKKATVTLGLERASGRLGVDLKTLRIVRAKPAFPFVNPAGRAVYTKRVTEMPQLKGAMISSDIPTWSFEELIDRGARLVRFTLHGYNMKPEQRGDWKDPDFKKVRKQYFDWLDRRLSQFGGLVPLARKRGVKMIPALFNLTGGKYPGTDEDAMFRDPKWADLFVETWMRIAWRLRAHTDVIYGYDLVNEPVQDRPAEKDCDWWNVQRRAAEAAAAVARLALVDVDPQPRREARQLVSPVRKQRKRRHHQRRRRRVVRQRDDDGRVRISPAEGAA